jgi:zinc transport system permease protein
MIMDDFILRAILAGLCLALMSSVLGVFVVWRRMSYFGESLAHSAMLGVALGLWFDISFFFAVIALAVLIAVLLHYLKNNGALPNDTILGIFSHTALSLGLVIISLIDAPNTDIMSYLFGDILTISNQELYFLAAMAIVVLLILSLIWRSLLFITVDEEIAKIEGVPVQVIELLFSVMLALVIAFGMKIVGILLITSLLIIPPATARRFSNTPEQMVLIALLVSCCSVVLGVYFSFLWDTPTGPSIVVGAAAMFMFSWLIPATKNR